MKRTSIAFVLAIAACSGSDVDRIETADRAAPEPVPVAETAAAVGAALLADTIDRSIVVYVEASGAEIDAVRADYAEEDFAVVADDLMYYRATATEYLEAGGQPLVRVQGRRPLTFRVSGAAREYDFADVELLDFIIVYEPDAEPRIFAPNEVELAFTRR
ncbi:MAG: hypothetical protein WEF86_01115 [Gemmatimonadota bacterium]